jgi:hypothetical protein
MKKLLYILLGLTVMISACKPDEPVAPKEQKGTLLIKIAPHVGGAIFNLGTRYTTADQQSYDITQLAFYMGDIYLVAMDNSLVPLKDILYVDLNPNLTPPYDPNVIGKQFPISVKAGEYKGIQYGLGVPPQLNGIQDSTFNPAQYPGDHPLSSYRGTAWSWAGYLFTIIEGGAYDQSGKENTMEYHVATDQFYTPVSQAVDLKIQDNGTDTLIMSLDVNKLFYQGAGDPNNINLVKESFTHSQGVQQNDISAKIMHNLSKALTPVR